jgi:hypothetical protein
MSSASAPSVVSHPSPGLGVVSSEAQRIFETWMKYSNQGTRQVLGVKLVAKMAHPLLKHSESWMRTVEGHLDELQDLHKLRVEVVFGKLSVLPPVVP